jgi:TonB family protein
MPLLRKGSNPAKRFFRISGTLLVAFFCSTISTYAQQAQIMALATKTAEAISKAHQKTVVVADFWGPKDKLTKLGQSLADQFSAELAGLGEFQVQDRVRLHKAIEQYNLSPLALRDIDIAEWMAHELGAKVVVTGDIEAVGSQYELTIDIFTVRDGKNVGYLVGMMPAGADWESLVQTTRDPDATGVPQAGEHGYTTPQCLYCPNPLYSGAAFGRHLQGVVVLNVIVGWDGRAHDIVVLKRLGLGLDENAVKAVHNYRFKPAIGPDGKSASVRMLFEMEFRLYSGPN